VGLELDQGLFYNTEKANCSVYESGLMAYNALRLSSHYTLDYMTVPTPLNMITNYDFIVFNWHQITMKHVTEEMIKDLRQRLGNIPIFTVVVECGPEDHLPLTPRWFDGYLVLDPTFKDSGGIFSMPRPLDEYEISPTSARSSIPTIGSFGFATRGKRFDLIIEQVNKEFDYADIRLNFPSNPYVYQGAELKMENNLRDLAKPGIELYITHDYLDKQALIGWLAHNDLNVFLYYRNMNGLAAVVDQAVSAHKPLLVSEDCTFRHVHKYMDPWPYMSFKDALEVGSKAVEFMYEDWHPKNFVSKFERIFGWK